MPQAYWIIPLEGGHISNELPGGPPGHVGGGPVYPGHPANRPPGSWGGPTDPGWGVTPPTDPGYGRPDWSPGHPTGGPIVPPQGGTEVPADDYAPMPPPEDIYSQYVVSVWDPKTATWTTKTYPPR